MTHMNNIWFSEVLLPLSFSSNKGCFLFSPKSQFYGFLFKLFLKMGGIPPALWPHMREIFVNLRSLFSLSIKWKIWIHSCAARSSREFVKYADSQAPTNAESLRWVSGVNKVPGFNKNTRYFWFWCLIDKHTSTKCLFYGFSEVFSKSQMLWSWKFSFWEKFLLTKALGHTTYTKESVQRN